MGLLGTYLLPVDTHVLLRQEQINHRNNLYQLTNFPKQEHLQPYFLVRSPLTVRLPLNLFLSGSLEHTVAIIKDHPRIPLLVSELKI